MECSFLMGSNANLYGAIKIDCTEKELSDLKDEVIEAIHEVVPTGSVLSSTHNEGVSDAVLGTLANWGIVIE